MKNIFILCLLFITTQAFAKLDQVRGTCVSTDQKMSIKKPQGPYGKVSKWCHTPMMVYEGDMLCTYWHCPRKDATKEGEIDCKVKRFELVDKSKSDKILPKGKASILFRKIENGHNFDFSAKNCDELIARDTKAYTELDKEAEESPRNYDADSCEWVSQIPRKIVTGIDGCNKNKPADICMGYVKCSKRSETEDAPSFIRQSTCSPENCGADKAVECTKEASFASNAPGDEEKLFIRTNIKNKIKEATKQ